MQVYWMLSVMTVLPIYWLCFTMFPLSTIFYAGVSMGFLCLNTCLEVAEWVTDLSWGPRLPFNLICIAWYGVSWCHSDVMAACHTQCRLLCCVTTTDCTMVKQMCLGGKSPLSWTLPETLQGHEFWKILDFHMERFCQGFFMLNCRNHDINE